MRMSNANMFKEASEKHSIRKCHIGTLGHTYHSIGNVVSKIEGLSNCETVEHVKMNHPENKQRPCRTGEGAADSLAYDETPLGLQPDHRIPSEGDSDDFRVGGSWEDESFFQLACMILSYFFPERGISSRDHKIQSQTESIEGCATRKPVSILNERYVEQVASGIKMVLVSGEAYSEVFDRIFLYESIKFPYKEVDKCQNLDQHHLTESDFKILNYEGDGESSIQAMNKVDALGEDYVGLQGCGRCGSSMAVLFRIEYGNSEVKKKNKTFCPIRLPVLPVLLVKEN
ncbi:hypothetical protein Tco_0639789 [Tanacetum coccineum]